MKLLLGALVLLVGAGCGSSSSSSPTYTSGQQVANAIGCTGFTDNSTELYVTDGGPCTLAGQSLTVYYFKDSTAQGNWQNAVNSMGLGGRELSGSGFIVMGPLAALNAAKAKVGGTVK